MGLVDKVKAYSRIGAMRLGISVHELSSCFDLADMPTYGPEDAGRFSRHEKDMLLHSDKWIASRYRIIAEAYSSVGNEKGAQESLRAAAEHDERARHFEGIKE